MANKVVRSDELKHYGVMGMKWGKRIAKWRLNSTEKKVHGMVRRYDRGKDVDRDDMALMSRRVRTNKARITRKIKRAQRFLAKSEKASAAGIVNRFNRDPEKKKLVKDYMKFMETQVPVLDELRLHLIDIRI